MSSDTAGEKDLADIEVAAPPAGWEPSTTDDAPNEGDVYDKDEGADD